MAIHIIRDLDEIYQTDSHDIDQIKKICKIYKISEPPDDINIRDITFSSPDTTKTSPSSIKKKSDIFSSKEFLTKYSLFVKIIYTCLKLDVNIFDVDEDSITIKNNYQFMKSLDQKKKEILSAHIDIIKSQIKNISSPITNDYKLYFDEYLTKLKIIENIAYRIKKIISADIVSETDNIMSLILPYFYMQTEYIEVYGRPKI